MVTPECGMKVKVGPLDQTVIGLAEALHTLTRSVPLRRDFFAPPPISIQERYLWEHRVEVLTAWYRTATQSNLKHEIFNPKDDRD